MGTHLESKAKRGLVLLSLGSLVACAGTAARPAPSAAEPETAAGVPTLDRTTSPTADSCDAIIAVSYNIRFDNPEDGVHIWRNRRDVLAQQLRRLTPDVVGLQEALHHQMVYLRDALAGFAVEGVGRDGGERGEYAAILFRESRFERIDGGTFWLSPTPERPRADDEEKPWGTHLNRIATWVVLRDRSVDSELLFVNVHMDHVSERARIEGARMIDAFTRSWRPRVDGIVVLGDFNARTGSAPYDLLDGRGRAPRPHLLDARHVAARAHESRLNTTVTSWTALVEDKYIDHVFVTPELPILEHAAVEERAHYQGAARYPSDHLPVRTELCALNSPERSPRRVRPEPR